MAPTAVRGLAATFARAGLVARVRALVFARAVVLGASVFVAPTLVALVFVAPTLVVGVFLALALVARRRGTARETRRTGERWRVVRRFDFSVSSRRFESAAICASIRAVVAVIFSMSSAVS